MVLVALMVLGGRSLRQHLLLDDQGLLSDSHWLDHLVLPHVAQAVAGPEPSRGLTAPLPINTCSVDSLTLLPGVGKVMADRIDALRRSGTVFLSREDLEKVRGIGPRLSARLDTLVLYVPIQPDTLLQTGSKTHP